VLYKTRMDMLANDKHSNLIVQFISNTIILGVVNMHPGAVFTTLQFLRNIQINPIN